MINERYMPQADNETRAFVTLVMLVAANAFGAFLGDMVGQRKTMEVCSARRSAFIVLRRFLFQHRRGLKIKFRVSFDGRRDFESPVSSPNIGYLFNVDHSSFMHPQKCGVQEEQINSICDSVIALWPAVKTMGLLPAIMMNKSHAMSTATMFNNSETQSEKQENVDASI